MFSNQFRPFPGYPSCSSHRNEANTDYSRAYFSSKSCPVVQSCGVARSKNKKLPKRTHLYFTSSPAFQRLTTCRGQFTPKTNPFFCPHPKLNLPRRRAKTGTPKSELSSRPIQCSQTESNQKKHISVSKPRYWAHLIFCTHFPKIPDFKRNG